MTRRIRVAVASDVAAIVGRLREADLNELAAVDPLMLTPVEALERAFQASTVCRTLVLGGVPEAMYGIVDRGGGRGQIWMMGAARVTEDRRWFLLESARQVEQLETGFREVYNFVDNRYEAALRWLAWLGFACVGTGVSQWSGLPLSLMVRRVGDDRSRTGADCSHRRSGRDGLRGHAEAGQPQGGQGP